jgi:succinylarginine dihydrolase
MMHEVNFDGLIGPSHNYAGLSLGNVASAKNAGDVSRPKQAALQGLSKMRLLMSLGLKQGVLLPHLRPHLPTLHALGFRGSPERMIADAHRADPALLRVLSSASAMWTANAATISPSADTVDAKLHLTVANLAAMPHRTFEHDFTYRMMSLIFADTDCFKVHPALPGGVHFGDEGAANHGRFDNGVELFVYGDNSQGRFPARQTRRASEAVARLHRVKNPLFIQQSNTAIQAGAFHNDVVSVTNGRILLAHEDAFEQRQDALQAISQRVPDVLFVEAPRAQVPLADAISSYLFNSQLVTLADGEQALIMPQECAETDSVAAFLQTVDAVAHKHFINVRESMRNGGGPACLRLRVAMTEVECCAADQRFILNECSIVGLEEWVERCYPDEIQPDDLADYALHRQCLTALDGLTQLLNLGSMYKFQAD